MKKAPTLGLNIIKIKEILWLNRHFNGYHNLKDRLLEFSFFF